MGQTYNTQPIDEYVIIGNDALFKCTIPSYVTDFVSVVSWADSDGEAIMPSNLSHGTLKALIIGIVFTPARAHMDHDMTNIIHMIRII